MTTGIYTSRDKYCSYFKYKPYYQFLDTMNFFYCTISVYIWCVYFQSTATFCSWCHQCSPYPALYMSGIHLDSLIPTCVGLLGYSVKVFQLLLHQSQWFMQIISYVLPFFVGPWQFSMFAPFVWWFWCSNLRACCIWLLDVV